MGRLNNPRVRSFSGLCLAATLLAVLAGCGLLRDPGYIAYSAGDEGSRSIGIVQPSGEHNTIIIDHPSDNFSPVWSPNQQRIAFLSTRDGYVDVYVARADGSGIMRVTHTYESESQVAWSPDGTRLAYVRPDPRGIDRVYWLRLTNLIPNRLEFTSVGETQPAWSPDGHWIAFVALSEEGNSLGIQLRNPGGVNQIRVTEGPGHWEPVWSPNGRRLAFVSELEDGRREIYVVDVDSEGRPGEPRRVIGDEEGDYFSPRWSPDSRRLAFLGREAPNRSVNVYTVTDRGTDLRPVTRNNVDEVALAWGRDGRIVFESRPTGRSALFIVDRDGTQRQLVGGGAAATQPDW